MPHLRSYYILSDWSKLHAKFMEDISSGVTQVQIKLDIKQEYVDGDTEEGLAAFEKFQTMTSPTDRSSIIIHKADGRKILWCLLNNHPGHLTRSCHEEDDPEWDAYMETKKEYLRMKKEYLQLEKEYLRLEQEYLQRRKEFEPPRPPISISEPVVLETWPL